MTKNIPPTEAAARSPNPPSNTGQAVRASVGDFKHSRAGGGAIGSAPAGNAGLGPLARVKDAARTASPENAECALGSVRGGDAGSSPAHQHDLSLTFIGDKALTLEVKRESRAQAWSDFCFCLALLAIIAGVVVAVMEVT